MDLRDALSMNSVHAPLEEMKRGALEQSIPGLREGWDFGVYDASCADIDVGGLHQACLAHFKREGGTLLCSAPLSRARQWGGRWVVETAAGQFSAPVIANAGGAWADEIAGRCGVQPIGIRPFRRTIVQLRVGRTGLRDLPLINDALERFYFKGESDNRVWVSPHDEIPSDPCDAAPEEIDIATAIDRFESVVDWPVERLERSWAGLRSFGPLRVPIYGYDADAKGFFWCAGQGGFGIQTSSAAAKLAAGLLLGEQPDPMVSGIDPALFSPSRMRKLA
jgi:D-arginine dehydrogenase